jgi:hypothetical protein
MKRQDSQKVIAQTKKRRACQEARIKRNLRLSEFKPPSFNDFINSLSHEKLAWLEACTNGGEMVAFFRWFGSSDCNSNPPQLFVLKHINELFPLLQQEFQSSKYSKIPNSHLRNKWEKIFMGSLEEQKLEFIDLISHGEFPTCFVRCFAPYGAELLLLMRDDWIEDICPYKFKPVVAKRTIMKSYKNNNTFSKQVNTLFKSYVESKQLNWQRNETNRQISVSILGTIQLELKYVPTLKNQQKIIALDRRWMKLGEDRFDYKLSYDLQRISKYQSRFMCILFPNSGLIWLSFLFQKLPSCIVAQVLIWMDCFHVQCQKDELFIDTKKENDWFKQWYPNCKWKPYEVSEEDSEEDYEEESQEWKPYEDSEEEYEEGPQESQEESQEYS